MPSPFSIVGNLYVVTGGAGHLGSAICKGLADHGAHVLCLSSKKIHVNELDHPEGKITSQICDVANEREFEDVLGKFINIHHGKINGLVNAAVRAPRGIDLAMSRESFNGALDTILTQYFTCSRNAAKHLPAGSAIVNLASMWGMVSPNPKVYLDLKNEPSLVMSAAAGGILSLTKYLAVVLAKDGIRVNSVIPGWFPRKRGPDRPDYMREIEGRIPMGRIGKAEEIVGSVIFLLSNASSYITGQSLTVDGGYTLN